jgi:hypothetical protein
MKKELEKLIDMVVRDGVVTEKERDLIFRKASELGEDPDEVELVLEFKLESLHSPVSDKKPTPASSPPQVKSQSSCRGCGATITSHFVCEFCGAPTNATAVSEDDEFAMLRELSSAAQRITSIKSDTDSDKSYELQTRMALFWRNAPLPRSPRPLMQTAREALSSITSDSDLDEVKLARAESALSVLRTDASVLPSELEALSKLYEKKKREVKLPRRIMFSIYGILALLGIITAIAQ